MKKLLLASVATFSLMTGAAFAQSTQLETTTRQTTVTPDISGQPSVKSHESRTTVESDGSATERSRSVEANPDGTVKVEKSKKTVDSDGEQTVRRKTVETGDGTVKVKKSRKEIDSEGNEIERTQTTTRPER